MKKLLSVIFAFIMAVSSVTVTFAANGPNRTLGYICIYNQDYSTEVYLINNYTSDPIGTIKGATYNKSTNTLTLNNFNQPKLSITTNTMGDDFKINLTGENHIQSLGIWGDGHGGSCEFTGYGSLYVNENKLAKDAILIVPEGASSDFKAGGSTTITAYSASDCNSLRVRGTDNKNCIQGNASAKPKVENEVYAKGISVINSIDIDSEIYDVYKMQGSSSNFAVELDEWTNATYVYIYQIVENPDDNTYILCHYSTGRYGAEYEFNPADFNLTKTDETVEAYETYYSTYEYLWHDNDGNEYIFPQTRDWETFEYYYEQRAVSEFVESESQYGGSIQWYKSVPVENSEKYADEAAVTKAGFSKTTGIIEGLYNLTITASPFTLKGGSHTHSYKNVVTPAKTDTNGKIVPTCSCGATKSATTIYKVSTVKLNSTSLTYNGKTRSVGVTVKDSKGKALTKGTDYTVSWDKTPKNVGVYTCTVKFKGKYTGSKRLTLKVNPAATTLSSVSAQSKALTPKWKKQATQTTGYEIQCATDSKFTKNKKTVTVSKNSTTSKKVTGLKAKTKYYVRVRTYKTVKVNGKNTKLYSGWSKVKTVTTKK